MNTELLKKDIQDSGLKIVSLAEKMNLTPQGLYNKINGVREFTATEITDYCRIRGKTIKDVEDIFFDKDVDGNVQN